MKRRILAMILSVGVLSGTLVGCQTNGSATEKNSESSSEELLDIEIDADTSFWATLDYAEEEEGNLNLILLMNGVYGTISEDMVAEQILFGGDLKDATNVEMALLDEDEVSEIEVYLTIPKGDLSADKLELNTKITLKQGSLIDYAGNDIATDVSQDFVLTLDNSDRGVTDTEQEFKLGERVRLTEDAKFTTGNSIPKAMKQYVWLLGSVKNNRTALLVTDETGKYNLNAWVDVKYLIKVEDSESTDDSSGSEAQDLTISDACVDLVASFEGCSLKAYPKSAEVWAIGYGHTDNVREGQVLKSKEEAKELLKEDLKKYEGYVKKYVKIELNQNQFDALVAFTYNAGLGNLRKLVSGRTPEEIAEAMLAYTKSGGKELSSLQRRRRAERDLFCSEVKISDDVVSDTEN